MSNAYEMLRLEALAQPVAIDGLLGFIKKRKVLVLVRFLGLLAGIFTRR
jgi:hypothetical protein